MPAMLPSFLRGTAGFLLFLLDTVFWGIPLCAVALAKALAPFPSWRRGCSLALEGLAGGWIRVALRVIRTLYRIEWDVAGVEGLDRQSGYLVVANHQSWVDTPVFLQVLGHRLPFPRFFSKKELLWIPLLGQALWALDFPLMHRYPQEKLERRPELRGRDLAVTRRSCERFRHRPFAVINFPEGTCFTLAKRDRQRSPFRHLLRPKAGGIALVLATLGDKIRTLVDMTIVYPAGPPTFWGFLCGQVEKVVVRVRQVPIPEELAGGDYETDPDCRERFREWLDRLWAEKEGRIETILHEAQ